LVIAFSGFLAVTVKTVALERDVFPMLAVPLKLL
jgi:hypothetical protein